MREHQLKTKHAALKEKPSQKIPWILELKSIEANPKDGGDKYVPDWNIMVNDTIFPDPSKGTA